ncbi:fungal-specific transcription factor domain-containing protein [Lipomyces doorenjongii]|uniref:fungal-specific transcription factor domain-containing protein n=1 Tax=Lipomyces doorenjongii TaxID=383834 RepID=UPI0034CED678
MPSAVNSAVAPNTPAPSTLAHLSSTIRSPLSSTLPLALPAPAAAAVSTATIKPATASATIGTTTARRRISRACDKCNQFRTRCDGKLPCKRCSDLDMQCEYARQMKKRGKGSHRYASKSSAHRDQQNELDQTADRTSASPVDATADVSPPSVQVRVTSRGNSGCGTMDGVVSNSSRIHQGQQLHHQQLLTHRFTNVSPASSVDSMQASSVSDRPGQSINHSDKRPSNRFAIQVNGSIRRNSSSVIDHETPEQHDGPEVFVRHMHSESEVLHDGDMFLDDFEESFMPDVVQLFSGDNGRTLITMAKGNNNQAHSTTASIFVQTPGTTSPRVLDDRSPFPSFSALFATPSAGTPRLPGDDTQCVYPVLTPILPSLDFITPSLAADLLEVYFSNTIYGIAHFTRKSSVLALHHPPRECSKALLYSFLYVAAHVSDHPHLTATPTSRTDIIVKLRDLTTLHLQPLVHADKNGTLDDVMSYIHLGIISSASEFKGASLRWWHAAWGLARVLKLNVEVPYPASNSASSSASSKLLMDGSHLSEETREERRRVWWLLFLVDRHLGLCYNRPLSVMDHESSGLYRPCRDELWHSDLELLRPDMDPSRERGLCYRVTGSDVWGYFLPLMTLLGGINDLHQLEMNNTLAITRDITEPIRANLRGKLDAFLKSVDGYDSVVLPPVDRDDDDLSRHRSKSPQDSLLPALTQQQRLTPRTCWKEYCRCLVHVFHILLFGYWDPIDMLSIPPTMVLDPEFVNVIQHSLDFAKCIKHILEVDQDLRIIPFFFGIHMLQGSFTLLYIVDVLGDKEVRIACETIVRAHEVCIVTLNTGYQRNFRQIMRGALQTIDVLDERRRHAHVPHRHLYGGSPPQDVVLAEIEDSKRRRRGLLSLYRWCRGGNGLAV